MYRITINSIDEINKLMKSLHNKPYNFFKFNFNDFK